MANIPSFSNPNYAPVANLFFNAVSVSTSGSATPAMYFRGLYINSTVTIAIVGFDDTEVTFSSLVIGQTLWVSGKYLTLTGSVAGGVVGLR